MADKKTGSARRPSRDEDEAPKKKQSGTQKSLKKSTSARKPPADDDDEDEAPAKPVKKGSARQGAKGDSARQGGAPPKGGPDAGRIFLYFVPGMILLLLGAGIYVMNLPDAPKKQDTTINFDSKVDEAKKKYLAAKNAADEGNKLEGERGVPKLAEAYKLLCESHNIIEGVRHDLKALEESKDPNVKVKEGSHTGDEKKASATGYKFDDDDQQINQLKVIVRKALAERPGGMEAIKQYVAEDQKNQKDEEDLLR